MKQYWKNENGQTIVIILLVMVVGLTIGLSMVSRSLTDLRISQQMEQSQRAFSGAEAGLEYALSQGLQSIYQGGGQYSNPNIGGNVSYSGVIQQIGASSYELKGKAAVEQDDVAQINLDGATAGSITILWGEKGTSQVPASPCDIGSGTFVASLELSFITQSGSTYGIQKYAYNACNALTNNFDPPTAVDADATYYAKIENISIPANAMILRIRPIYNKASIKIIPSGGNLPEQAYKLTVKGEAQGNVRAIEWQQPIKPALPAIFDYVIFNGNPNTSLSK
jgi:hypothetical protein